MKTKREYMKATMPQKGRDNAINHGSTKEVVSSWELIDKKTEKTVVECVCYMGRSRSAQTVYASVWMFGEGFHTSGRGTAGGGGYDKESSAVNEALLSAGVQLWGSPYNRADARYPGAALFKKEAHINGIGDQAVENALLAVAYAMGYRDVIVSH